MSIIGKSALFLAGILLIFFGSYYVHAKIVNHVVANRYYHASSSYKKILDTKKLFQVQNFPLILKDYLYFIPSFESSIKSNDANSSRPYSWPFENKSINYRWAADHGATRYLYFLGNPLIWFAGLVGIILGFSLVIAVLFFKLPVQLKDKKLFFTIAFLLSLYAGFMASLMMVRRVVYLYHYLVPLVISLLIAFTIFYYLKQNALARNEKNVYLWVGFFVIGIIAVYYFFSPLTYYQPLTKDAFFWRNWFSFWHLQPF